MTLTLKQTQPIIFYSAFPLKYHLFSLLSIMFKVLKRGVYSNQVLSLTTQKKKNTFLRPPITSTSVNSNHMETFQCSFHTTERTILEPLLLHPLSSPLLTSSSIPLSLWLFSLTTCQLFSSIPLPGSLISFPISFSSI